MLSVKKSVKTQRKDMAIEQTVNRDTKMSGGFNVKSGVVKRCYTAYGQTAIMQSCVE